MKGCFRFALIAVGIVIALFVFAALMRPSSTTTPTAAPQGQPTSAAAPVKPQATVAPQPTATAVTLPTVGGQASKGGWAIGINDMRAVSKLGETQFSKGTTAQGLYVLLTMTAKNLQQKTSNLNTWDFVMKTPGGVEFKTSSEGSTSLLMSSPTVKPLSLAEEVQPGLQKNFALVFDVNPDVRQYVLTAAGIDFQINLP
jgi:hypothetical protein